MAVYVPLAQSSQLSYLSSLVDVWTTGDPIAIAGSVRREIEAKGRQIVLESESLTSRIDWVLTNDRLIAWSASFVGILATLLAGIGLYGLMSYLVTRRTGEMGIRIALGASPGSILWLVLRDVSTLVLVGLALGVLGTLAVACIAQVVLFGLSGTDPFVLAGSAAALFAATFGRRLSACAACG